MSWVNYHTHCHYCDGAEAPLAYVEAAGRMGLRALGFSCHAPTPFRTDWTMAPELLADYCQVVRDLDARSGKRLKVHLALEIDYIPGLMGPADPQFQALGLDYTIGSIHYGGVFPDGRHWSIDDSEEEYLAGLEAIHGGEAEGAVRSYYERIADMARLHRPDIIGHLDVIKKNNTSWGAGRDPETFFSEDAEWYRQAVRGALEAIAEAGCIVEVNTGGLVRARASALYPSEWILAECRAMDIPIGLNADAHQPEQVMGLFAETARCLQDLGFDRLRVLTPEGWQGVAFSPAGLDLDGLQLG